MARYPTLQNRSTVYVKILEAHNFHGLQILSNLRKLSTQNFRLSYTWNSFTITLLTFKMALYRYLEWHPDDELPDPRGSLSIKIPFTSIVSANVEVRPVVSQEPASRGSYNPRKLFPRNVWKWQSTKVVCLEIWTYTVYNLIDHIYTYIVLHTHSYIY